MKLLARILPGPDALLAAATALAAAVAVGLALDPVAAEPGPAEGPGIARVALALGALAAVGAVALAWRARPGARRPRLARRWLAFWLAVAPVAALALEALPSPEIYSGYQERVQGQIARRERGAARIFRDTALSASFDGVGWPEEALEEESGPPVVFLGDSFLESMSSRNLAERVEDLLAERGRPVAIANLSMEASDPAVGQRHRFHEIAIPRAPDEIVLFVYEGNDLWPGYRFEPYRHMRYAVTAEAVEVLRETRALGDATLERLAELAREGRPLASRGELERALEDGDLGAEQRELVYLACLAYSDRAPFAGPLVNARVLLRRFAHALVGAAARALGSPGDAWRRDWSGYAGAFGRPLDERPAALARWVSSVTRLDAAEVRELLEAQPEEFRSELTAEPDATILLLVALQHALDRDPDPGPPLAAAELEATVRAYVALVEEYTATARVAGRPFSVVLIPEAAQVDADLRRFWSGVTDLRAIPLLREKHAIAEGLRARWPVDVPLLDLGEHERELSGGYWRFDGHWNERGNAAAAELVADFLEERLRMGDASVAPTSDLGQSVEHP